MAIFNVVVDGSFKYEVSVESENEDDAISFARDKIEELNCNDAVCDGSLYITHDDAVAKEVI